MAGGGGSRGCGMAGVKGRGRERREWGGRVE